MTWNCQKNNTVFDNTSTWSTTYCKLIINLCNVSLINAMRALTIAQSKKYTQSFQTSTKLKAKITYELHYENETTKLKVDWLMTDRSNFRTVETRLNAINVSLPAKFCERTHSATKIITKKVFVSRDIKANLKELHKTGNAQIEANTTKNIWQSQPSGRHFVFIPQTPKHAGRTFHMQKRLIS